MPAVVQSETYYQVLLLQASDFLLALVGNPRLVNVADTECSQSGSAAVTPNYACGTYTGLEPTQGYVWAVTNHLASSDNLKVTAWVAANGASGYFRPAATHCSSDPCVALQLSCAVLTWAPTSSKLQLCALIVFLINELFCILITYAEKVEIEIV